MFEPEPELPEFIRHKVRTSDEIKHDVKVKRSRRAWVYATLIGFLIVIGFAGYAAYKVNEWFDYNRLQFRSPIQSPILIEKRITKAESHVVEVAHASDSEALPPVIPKTRKEQVMARKNGAVLWRIYGLESTWGDRDSCLVSGKINGFGYGQNKSQWFCYDSFEVVLGKVEARVDELVGIYGLKRGLCMYNSGAATNGCTYYDNYLSLKVR